MRSYMDGKNQRCGDSCAKLGEHGGNRVVFSSNVGWDGINIELFGGVAAVDFQ